MNLRHLSFALSIALLGVLNVHAQGDFFFTSSQGGANQDQTVNLDVGDSGSLWLYWSTNGPADSDLFGGFIDIFTSNSGVIEFTAAETFDYDFTVGGNPTGFTRWAGEGFGPSTDFTSDFINELAGFTVTGDGILEANNGSGVFLDAGYTAANDGFEFGRVDFNVIGSGTTSVTADVGDGQLVSNGQAIDATFTTLTVVAANSVPEPTSAGLLALGLMGLATRRRR